MKIAIQEAYTNEYKGNLLEFLVGQQLAKHFQQEQDYFQGITPRFFQQLISYEQQLRQLNPQLAQMLPAYAQKLANLAIAEFAWARPQIRLVGKLASSNDYQEADLFIQEQSRIFPLSIKFTKHHAYINTKSGGIKSFVSKYFGVFPQATEMQQELNRQITIAFFQMGEQMYQLAGGSFPGKFDATWPWKLPSELPAPYHSFLLVYYQKVIVSIFDLFQRLYQDDPQSFARCLSQLVGHSGEHIYHLFAFHSGDYADLAAAKFVLLAPEFYQLPWRKIKLTPYEPGRSFFEIELPQFLLQIRVKPMNIYTVPALKVNCSIRMILGN